MDALNEADKRMKSPDLQMWLAETTTSSRIKYSIFFRDFIRTLPKESALCLLRVHMQREPRYSGTEFTDERVMSYYDSILHPEQME